MPPKPDSDTSTSAGQQSADAEPTLRDILDAVMNLSKRVGDLEQRNTVMPAPQAQAQTEASRDDPFGPGPQRAASGALGPYIKVEATGPVRGVQDVRAHEPPAGMPYGDRYLAYGNYTPALRPGPNPGAQGLTPAAEPMQMRGVSGLMIPITPNSRGKVRPTTTEAAQKALDVSTPAKERAAAARAAFAEVPQNEAFKNFCHRLFPVYFRHAEAHSPNASDEQLISTVEKQLAVDLEEQQRGSKVPGRIPTQPFKDVTKLTRKNWRDWISEIQAHLSAIPYANEHLEGLIHGENYDANRPGHVHELYDPQLDKELGAILLGTIDPSCRAPIFNLQGTGEHRGSFFFRAVLQYIRHKIWDEQQDGKERVETFGERLRGLFLELQSLGAVVPEEDQIDYPLRGVNRRLLITQQQIVDDHHSGKVTTFEEALTRLIRAENALDVFRREQPHTSASAQRAEAVPGRAEEMREQRDHRRTKPSGAGAKGTKGKGGSG
ncbi:hypothetical protein V8E36_007860 [Tilletia maclaganii]